MTRKPYLGLFPSCAVELGEGWGVLKDDAGGQRTPGKCSLICEGGVYDRTHCPVMIT